MFQGRHVYRRFRTMAQQCADRVALSFRDAGGWGQWSYATLDERARTIGERLERLGAGKGTPVAVMAHRYPDTIAAMIGVLGLGAHYVPLDPMQPEARTRGMMDAAGVAFVVSADAPDGDGSPVPIEAVTSSGAHARRAAAESEALAAPPESPEAVAYVMFTSGSTGRPKGVVIPHRAIARLVAGQDYLRFDESRVFLQAAPMSFDAATLEIWGPLLHGGRCVLYPAGALPTAAGLRDVIAATGVTTAWLTASLFHAIVDHDVRSLAGLEELIVGGESLSVPHVHKALAELPDTQLINGYGPTENTTFSACHRIPRDMPRAAPRVPIGRAIRGTQLAVLDEHLRPVSPGSEGELVAMGEGLALCYLDQPELTQERFVSVVGVDGVARRGYRTGDRVVELADGVLDFLGRRDEQVKIHGYRIEPREVESVIAGTSGVVQCRVVVQPDAAGQARLAAYVVLREGMTVSALQQAIAAALPVYMVPHQIVSLPSLPLNQNGKLATESLPKPASEPVAARPIRRGDRLAFVEQAWTEALGRAPESSDVNFFDAGGRSLDAMRLHDLLERGLALTLDPTFVFEFSTPRRQAGELTALLAKARPAPHGDPGGARPDPR